MAGEDSPGDLLHEISGRLATEGGFHEVLARVVEFASALVKCDSCLIYVLEGEELARVSAVVMAAMKARPDLTKYGLLPA